MKTMSATDFKKNFSALFKQMAAGEIIAVTDDKTKQIIGYFTCKTPIKPKRQLGILEGKATINFRPDWEMTDEAFLGLGDAKI